MSREEETLRVVRIIHLAMIFSVLAIGAVGEIVRSQGSIGEPPANLEFIQMVLLAMLAGPLGVLAVLRSRWVAPAADSLRTRPDDEEAWNRWRGGNIICFALCESIVVFGFVLRLLGGTLVQSAPFYVIGLLLLVGLTPRNPTH